jgi:poly(ADP-ribose) glycohydrolase ARH3
MLGVAVGDAIGAPFEGELSAFPASLEDLGDTDYPLRYTDDTHMTLGMAESLVRRRGFDGAHMAAVFAHKYAEQPWRGYGAGPPQVFRLIEQGVPWGSAAKKLFGGLGSYGNGAAMRVAPAALLAFPDLDRVALLARQTSMITHGHELGIEGAVLQATAIALLLGTPRGGLDPDGILSTLGVHVGSSEYRARLERVRTLPHNAPLDAVVAELGTGVAAIESVPTALYTFLRNRDSFVGTATYAVSLGGDTDTIASMACALSGAFLGEEAIPVAARERVEGAEALRMLADALLGLAAGTPVPLGR